LLSGKVIKFDWLGSFEDSPRPVFISRSNGGRGSLLTNSWCRGIRDWLRAVHNIIHVWKLGSGTKCWKSRRSQNTQVWCLSSGALPTNDPDPLRHFTLTLLLRTLPHLADFTATQCARLLASHCRLSVCMSVRLSVHCGAQGWWRGLKPESCVIMFLGRHFLFTSSDTFAIRYIVQPQPSGM